MQTPLQITFRGIEPSEALERRIRTKAQVLERFHDHIIACHVTIEAPHQHHHQGHVYSVRVDIRVPHGEIVVTKESGQDHAHEDAYVAIRDAFDAAVRQLEDRVRTQRGDVKHHEVFERQVSPARPIGKQGTET